MMVSAGLKPHCSVHAGIDDEDIVHVVNLASNVHHRALRIVAHAAGAAWCCPPIRSQACASPLTYESLPPLEPGFRAFACTSPISKVWGCTLPEMRTTGIPHLSRTLDRE